MLRLTRDATFHLQLPPQIRTELDDALLLSMFKQPLEKRASSEVHAARGTVAASSVAIPFGSLKQMRSSARVYSAYPPSFLISPSLPSQLDIVTQSASDNFTSPYKPSNNVSFLEPLDLGTEFLDRAYEITPKNSVVPEGIQVHGLDCSNVIKSAITRGSRPEPTYHLSGFARHKRPLRALDSPRVMAQE